MANKMGMTVSQEECERDVSHSQRMAETDRMSDFATVEDRAERRAIEISREKWFEEALQKAFEKELKNAREEGLAEEFEEEFKERFIEGFTKGVKKGRKEAAIEVAQKMLSLGEPVEKIKRFTGLSSDEIARLRID